jgi:glycosyltransferase involved in cell wall biosynthesis
MKKVFFIISHLKAGGSEKVFWILAQHFDQSIFDVYLVVLDSREIFYSRDLAGVHIIDLNSPRASKSVFKLLKLINKEKPYAVFTTGGHINTLLAFISLFVKIPKLIGRESNVMDIMTKLGGVKEKFWDKFLSFTYNRFDIAVCQSAEIQKSLANHYNIIDSKLIVIPNPVLAMDIIKTPDGNKKKRIIIIARLAVEKGIMRFLSILRKLPHEYTLTIAGEGPLKMMILKEIGKLKLSNRVKLVGVVRDVPKLLVSHDLLALPSITEGFPNVVLESLAVGVPVVAFGVGGIGAILNSDFNGYIIAQDDLDAFEKGVLKACQKKWDHAAIKADVETRFGVQKIVKQYEALLA